MSIKNTLKIGDVITFDGRRYMITFLSYCQRVSDTYGTQYDPIMDCRLEATSDFLDPAIYPTGGKAKPRRKPRTKSKKK